MNLTRPEPKFDWFIPIDGDGEHIGTSRAERPPTFEYLREVVETAEDQGFYSLLIPTRFANGLFDEGAPLAETWTTVTALAAVTSRIRFLVAVRPGFISTGLFAQMAATLDRISGGRLDINVVPGGIQGDFERLGEVSDHAHRYARAEEFIAACRRLWESPEPVWPAYAPHRPADGVGGMERRRRAAFASRRHREGAAAGGLRWDRDGWAARSGTSGPRPSRRRSSVERHIYRARELRHRNRGRSRAGLRGAARLLEAGDRRVHLVRISARRGMPPVRCRGIALTQVKDRR